MEQEQETYELEPMQLASGGWAVPCPTQAACDHMNAVHPVRYFGDLYGRRDS